MSVVLATRYADRVEMATDGGLWDQGGCLTAAKDKIVYAPNAPLAVAGVGPDEEVSNLVRFVISATMGATVDEAIAYLERVLPDRPEICSAYRWELVIAAVSETSGPNVWHMHELRPDEGALPELHKPFSDYTYFGPALSPDQLRTCGWSPIDFSAGLVPQMQMMRSLRSSPNTYSDGRPCEPGHFVGCHVDHAVVTASGVTVDRVHSWPGVIGQKIIAEGIHD